MADGRTSFAPRGPVMVWRAFLWSLRGLVAAFRTESSFRLEVYLLVPMAPLAFWLGTTTVEKLLLFGVLLPVLAAELLNSSLEALVDRVSPEISELAGRAKDMGSAAVFVLMVNVVVCWAIVLLPRIMS
jgi:diacylglycerol kinase (ATP)